MCLLNRCPKEKKGHQKTVELVDTCIVYRIDKKWFNKVYYSYKLVSKYHFLFSVT